ncbi:MAG: pantothenate kinase [Alphaproteobacteria bacterium]|nr:MAG: pantothenate kinase [Alphaproteobacteria bacterium]
MDQVNRELDDFWSGEVAGVGEPRRISPYRFFTAAQWSGFRADTPMTLTEEEVRRLRSLGDPVSLEEVERIYLSMSRLLSAHVEATQALFRQRSRFLNINAAKTPFIIGIAGSVAVGKSTVARVLKELLARWPSSPRVALVTTDGFLLPNAVLEERGLMERKGFPESYDVGEILRFLSAIKAGEASVQAPVYSHLHYDVVPGQFVRVDRPDILVFEGINVLQTRDLPEDGKAVPFVSDFFDFSIYIDADENHVERWYVDRFMRLRETAFRNPESFFHRYSTISDDEALARAQYLWNRINLVNLKHNILPTRPRADLILRKGATHLVEHVALRKL